MALLVTSTLAETYNTYFRKKYRNPPVVVDDPVVGLIVKHGAFRYRATSWREAFEVAAAWGKRERPANQPLPKNALLELCCSFLSALNHIKDTGAEDSDVDSAIRWVARHAREAQT